MTLKESTVRAGAALEAGDLDALARALAERRKAFQAGERPAPDVYQSGQQLLRALLEYQQSLAYESARLGQIRRYVEGPPEKMGTS